MTPLGERTAEAKTWWTLAAAQGYADAIEALASPH